MTTQNTITASAANADTAETLNDRIARLGLADIGEKRMETLGLAMGVDDDTFVKIAKALRVWRNSKTCVLPAHRYENLSRGRGWARKGKGAKVEWADRAEDGGYVCGPGRWSVGATDGFSRKDSVEWDVSHVTVAGQTWTIAS